MAKRGKRATRRVLSDSSDESDSESKPQTKQPRVAAGDQSSDASDVEIDFDESEDEKGDDCNEQTSDEESDGESVEGLIDDDVELDCDDVECILLDGSDAGARSEAERWITTFKDDSAHLDLAAIVDTISATAGHVAAIYKTDTSLCILRHTEVDGVAELAVIVTLSDHQCDGHARRLLAYAANDHFATGGKILRGTVHDAIGRMLTRLQRRDCYRITAQADHWTVMPLVQEAATEGPAAEDPADEEAAFLDDLVALGEQQPEDLMDEDNTPAIDASYKLTAEETEELVEQRRVALDDRGNYPVLGKVKAGTELKDGYLLIHGMGGKHSYLDGTEKFWRIDGTEVPAGNGLFHLKRTMLPSLCDTLVKCKWHMVPVIKDEPFCFVADFDDKKGVHIGSLSADVLKRTLERALRKYWEVDDTLEVVIMPRNDQCGYHAWTNVVVDQREGWIPLCKAVIAHWQKELADEGFEVGLGAGKELDNDIYQSKGVSLRPPYVFKNHSSTDSSSAYIPIGYEQATRQNMRKFIGYPPEGALVTPLTDDGRAASTTVDDDNDPKISAAITQRLNRLLGEMTEEPLPEGLVHYVKERGEYEGKSYARITNNMGLCYSAATKGELYLHTDGMNEVALQLYKSSATGMCFGQHGNCSCTRRDNDFKDLRAVKTLCGLYGDAARTRLLGGNAGAEDGDGDWFESKMTTKMRMARRSLQIINEIAERHRLRKENGYVMQPNPLSKHDFVQIEDGLDYNDFITQCMGENEELNHFLHCDIGLKSSLCTFLDKNDDPQFPVLRRERNAIACRDGVLFLDDDDGPNMRFVPTDEVEHGLVARVFIDEEYSIEARAARELKDMKARHKTELELAGDDTDEIQMAQIADTVVLENKYETEEELCDLDESMLLTFVPLFRRTMKDQHFNSDTQSFGVPGRESMDWTVEQLLLAFCGRLQYPTGKWDDYAFMLWLFGRSRTGKSFCTNVQKEYFANIGTVHSAMERTFGKAPLADVELVQMPDIKKPKGGEFPLDESSVQLLIEGGRTDIPRKNRDPLKNYKIDAPAVADSNKTPGQVWSDEAGAIINRVAMIKYKRDPRVRDSRLIHKMRANWELLPLLILQVKMYQKLRAHAGDSTFKDWAIPLFMDERAKVEMQNDHMLRFLTAARGDMGTKDLDIWCEYNEGSETTVRELRGRFDAWMTFSEHIEYQWTDIDLKDSLDKAGVEHEGEFLYQEQTHFYECNACKKDVTCGEHTTLGACCNAYKDNMAPMSLKAKRKKVRAKNKAAAATIKNLTIHAEPKAGVVSAPAPTVDMSGWEWNGQCGCGQKASLRTSREGVQYFCCFFGAVDDAQCTLRYRPRDQMPPVAAHGGAKWP